MVRLRFGRVAAEPVREPSGRVRVAADDGGEQTGRGAQPGQRVVQVAARLRLPVPGGRGRGRRGAGQREDPRGALRGRPGEGEGHRDLLEGAQRMVGEGHGAVDGDQFADLDPPVEREPDAVHHDRDEQQAGQHDLDCGDQRPHAGVAHGRPAHLLGGGAVAAQNSSSPPMPRSTRSPATVSEASSVARPAFSRCSSARRVARGAAAARRGRGRARPQPPPPPGRAGRGGGPRRRPPGRRRSPRTATGPRRTSRSSRRPRWRRRRPRRPRPAGSARSPARRSCGRAVAAPGRRR